MLSRMAHLGPLVALSLIGCATTPPTSTTELPAPDQSLPVATGSFAGRYVVPTTPDLSAAATFSVKEVDWTVAGNVVTLEYALPVGLVGGTARVALTGTLAGTQATLTGAVGSGACTATATTVTCREELSGLGAMPISMAVVQAAATDYAGPVADRVTVASLFGSDPIGFVEIDLSTPVPFGIDDHGGGAGHGGGSGI